MEISSNNSGSNEIDWTPTILRNRINGLNIKGTPKLSRSNREVLKIIYEICLEKDKERKEFKREKEIYGHLDYHKSYFMFDNLKFCEELEKIEYKSKGVTVIYEKVYQLLESEGLKPKRQQPTIETTSNELYESPSSYSAPSSPKFTPQKAYSSSDRFHPYKYMQPQVDEAKASAQQNAHQMALIFQMEQAHKIINPQVIQVKPTVEVQCGPKLTSHQFSLKFQEEQALVILNHQKKKLENELNTNFQITSAPSLPSSIQSSPLFPVQSLQSLQPHQQPLLQQQHQSIRPYQYQQYQQPVQPNQQVMIVSSSSSNTPTSSNQSSPIIVNETSFEIPPKEVISAPIDRPTQNIIVRPTPLKYSGTTTRINT